MVRPSDSSAVRRSSVTVSVVARICCVSTVEEVIPRVHQLSVMIRDNLLDPPKFLRREASATFEADGIEPELRLAVVPFHMYMGRFIAVTREEEKPIWSNAQDCGHRCFTNCACLQQAWSHSQLARTLPPVYYSKPARPEKHFPGGPSSTGPNRCRRCQYFDTCNTLAKWGESRWYRERERTADKRKWTQISVCGPSDLRESAWICGFHSSAPKAAMPGHCNPLNSYQYLKNSQTR